MAVPSNTSDELEYAFSLLVKHRNDAKSNKRRMDANDQARNTAGFADPSILEVSFF